MAEPVIISYARGLLSRVPRRPRGHRRRDPGRPRGRRHLRRRRPGPGNDDGCPDITQVASGSANPLKYERLVDLVQDWFTEHPLYDSEGQPISVPRVGLPRPRRGRGPAAPVHRRCSPPAERCSSTLPLRGKQAAVVGQLEEKRELAERALTYVELYGAYTECEAIYGVDAPARPARVPRRTEDQRDFGCDPRVIDWAHYVHEIHLPSVVKQARVRTDGSKGAGESRVHPPAPPGAVPAAPDGRVRPREHAHRVERRHLLRLAGHPAADPGGQAARSPPG